VEVLYFEESAATMRSIRLVTYNACLKDSTISFEVFEHLFIGPELGHLADEKAHVDSGAFEAAFAEQNFLLDGLLGVLHFSNGLFVIDHLALAE